MTPTQHLIATQAQRLIPEVSDLYERALKLERDHGAELQQVDVAYRDSARNLLHYLAVRHVDIRQLQASFCKSHRRAMQ
jgi:pyruvate kinase